jgi:hypothetical protein
MRYDTQLNTLKTVALSGTVIEVIFSAEKDFLWQRFGRRHFAAEPARYQDACGHALHISETHKKARFDAGFALSRDFNADHGQTSNHSHSMVAGGLLLTS